MVSLPNRVESLESYVTQVDNYEIQTSLRSTLHKKLLGVPKHSGMSTSAEIRPVESPYAVIT